MSAIRGPAVISWSRDVSSPTERKIRTKSWANLSELSFLPNSVVEHWLLAEDNDESFDEEQRKNCDPEMVSDFIKKIVDNLSIIDPSVQLNGVLLLESVSRDFPKQFGGVLYVLFTRVQDFLQESSRILRTAALRLAVSIVTQIPFTNISKILVNLLDNSLSNPSMAMKVVSTALLNVIAYSIIDDKLELTNNRIPIRNAVVQILKLSFCRLCMSATSSSGLLLESMSHSSFSGSESTTERARSTESASDLVAIALKLLELLEPLQHDLLVKSKTYNTSDIFYKNTLFNILDDMNTNRLGTHAPPLTPLSMQSQKEILTRIKTLQFPSLMNDNNINVKIESMVHLIRTSDASVEDSSASKSSAATAADRSNSNAGAADMLTFGPSSKDKTPESSSKSTTSTATGNSGKYSFLTVSTGPNTRDNATLLSGSVSLKEKSLSIHIESASTRSAKDTPPDDPIRSNLFSDTPSAGGVNVKSTSRSQKSERSSVTFPSSQAVTPASQNNNHNSSFFFPMEESVNVSSQSVLMSQQRITTVPSNDDSVLNPSASSQKLAYNPSWGDLSRSTSGKTAEDSLGDKVAVALTPTRNSGHTKGSLSYDGLEFTSPIAKQVLEHRDLLPSQAQTQLQQGQQVYGQYGQQEDDEEVDRDKIRSVKAVRSKRPVLHRSFSGIGSEPGQLRTDGGSLFNDNTEESNKDILEDSLNIRGGGAKTAAAGARSGASNYPISKQQQMQGFSIETDFPMLKLHNPVNTYDICSDTEDGCTPHTLETSAGFSTPGRMRQRSGSSSGVGEGVENVSKPFADTLGGGAAAGNAVNQSTESQSESFIRAASSRVKRSRLKTLNSSSAANTPVMSSMYRSRHDDAMSVTSMDSLEFGPSGAHNGGLGGGHGGIAGGGGGGGARGYGAGGNDAGGVHDGAMSSYMDDTQYAGGGYSGGGSSSQYTSSANSYGNSAYGPQSSLVNKHLTRVTMLGETKKAVSFEDIHSAVDTQQSDNSEKPMRPVAKQKARAFSAAPSSDSQYRQSPPTGSNSDTPSSSSNTAQKASRNNQYHQAMSTTEEGGEERQEYIPRNSTNTHNPQQQQPRARKIASAAEPSSPRTVSPRASRTKSSSMDAHSHSHPHSVPAKSENFDYLATEDIQPSEAPMQDLSKAMLKLENPEWPDIFYILNNIRKLALHHASVLVNSGLLHNLVVLLMKQVDNLRSTLAKNALITVGDMFIGLRTEMDSEVSTALPNLLKRSADSSIFINKSADNALLLMLQYVSTPRSLSSLLVHCEHKNPVIRGKVAALLNMLLQTKHLHEFTSATREVDNLKLKIAKFVNDQTPEARSNSRNIIKLLIEKRLCSRGELESAVSVDIVDKSLRAPLVVPLEMTNVTSSASSAASASAAGSSSVQDIDRGSPTTASGTAKASATGSKYTARRARPSALNMPSTDEAASTSTRLSAGSSRSNQGFADPTYIISPTNSIESADSLVFNYEQDTTVPVKSSTVTTSSSAGSHQKSGGLPLHPHNSSGSGSSHPDDRPIKSSCAESTSPATAAASSSSGAGSSATKPRSKSAGVPASAAAAKRIMESDDELQSLPTLLNTTASNSWTERRDAMTKLTTLMIKHSTVLRQAGKLNNCLDHILERLEDGSVKVNIHTLECLERIHAEDPSILQQNLLPIVAPAMLNSASSNNKQISVSSSTLLHTLFQSLSAVQIAQFLCHTAQHDKDKLRLAALRFIVQCIPQFCATKETTSVVVKKHVFPTLGKIYMNVTTKGELKMHVSEALKTLQSQVGNEPLWSWTEDIRFQDELRRITL